MKQRAQGVRLPIGAYLLVATSAITLWSCAPSVVEITPNAAPSLTSVSPDPVIPSPAGTTIRVNGSNFMPTSRVRWNFQDRIWRFIDQQTIELDLIASDVAAVTMGLVTVENPAPGGGTTNLHAVIGAPAPTLTALSATRARTGAAPLDITLSGSGFTSSSTVLVNDSLQLAIPFLSYTQMKATIPAGMLAAPGTYRITVFNFPPAGGLSDVIRFTVDP